MANYNFRYGHIHNIQCRVLFALLLKSCFDVQKTTYEVGLLKSDLSQGRDKYIITALT